MIVEREIDLYLATRRVCRDCRGQMPIHDHRSRTVETVFGAVTVKNPRCVVCQRCSPGFLFSISPVTQHFADRATPELITPPARLGALLPYRQAADILATFVPGQNARRFTTLRNRALRTGAKIEKADTERSWREPVDRSERLQPELPLEDNLAREIVFNIDTAFVPRVRNQAGRTFESVVCHAARGGRGGPPSPVFAFAETQAGVFRSLALQNLRDQSYLGRGEITVISDGEDCLKRLAADLPQPVTHILDWIHVAMKVPPLIQLGASAPATHEDFGDAMQSVKWWLWHGKADRALALMARSLKALERNAATCLWSRRAAGLLDTLSGYIRRNCKSVANYGARHRAGKRIATTSAEASVNALVAKRFVKKQQMRWSVRGADLLLQVRTAVINGDLETRPSYTPPPANRTGLVEEMFRPVPPLLQAA